MASENNFLGLCELKDLLWASLDFEIFNPCFRHNNKVGFCHSLIGVCAQRALGREAPLSPPSGEDGCGSEGGGRGVGRRPDCVGPCTCGSDGSSPGRGLVGLVFEIPG